MKVEIDVVEKLDAIHKDLVDIKVEIATLKVKSGMWGAAAAILVLLPTILLILSR
jgi:hypothetical protein